MHPIELLARAIFGGPSRERPKSHGREPGRRRRPVQMRAPHHWRVRADRTRSEIRLAFVCTELEQAGPETRIMRNMIVMRGRVRLILSGLVFTTGLLCSRPAIAQ